jgi:transposase-like protein
MDTQTPIRRRYSDQEQADALAALDANGGEVARTAAALGIPDETLRMWARGLRRPHNPQLLASTKEALAERLEAIAQSMAGVIEGGLDRISPSQAAIIMGISIEKFLLLRGEATSITTTADDERSARLRERYTKRPVVVTDAQTTAQPPGPVPEVVPETPVNPGESGEV